MNEDKEPSVPPGMDTTPSHGHVSLVRTGVAGVLMGLANLVPGVSGGTMVLVMGLYDDFVSSVADATRLKFTKRGVLFLGVLVVVVGTTIGLFSGVMGWLVSAHRSAMYALFIGMTLGGAPLLWSMIKPMRPSAAIGSLAGLAAMIAIVVTRPAKPEPPPDVPPQVAIEAAYGVDVAAGALGISAMVLPGISGAYMLLVLERYEPILAAVHAAMKYGTSLGRTGSLGEFLPVLIP